MQTVPLDKLLTPAEVATALGISIETLSVWRSTKRYALPYVKIGRLVRYRAKDVAAFMAQRSRLTDQFTPNHQHP